MEKENVNDHDEGFRELTATGNQGKYWLYVHWPDSKADEKADFTPYNFSKVPGVVLHHRCLETHEDENSAHFHGALYFESNKRFKALKKLNKRTSWFLKSSMSSHEQVFHYIEKPVDGCDCKKCTEKYTWKMQIWTDGDKSEFLNLQKKNIWKDIMEDAKTIKDTKHFIEKYPGNFAQGYKAIDLAIKEFHDKPRDPSIPVEVLVFWGDPGAMKSKTAWERYPNRYLKNDLDVKWWPKYQGEETVVINDFRGHQCKMSHLLNLLDRYPYIVEKKGSDWNLNVKTWIITSNYHPSKWYKKEWNDQNPLRRRIKQIIEFKVDPNRPVHVPVEMEFINGSFVPKALPEGQLLQFPEDLQNPRASSPIPSFGDIDQLSD